MAQSTKQLLERDSVLLYAFSVSVAACGCFDHGIRACDLCPTPGMTAGSCPRGHSLAQDCCLLTALASHSSLVWAERIVCIIFMLFSASERNMALEHLLLSPPPACAQLEGHWLPMPGASSVLSLRRAAAWSLGEVSWPINNIEVCLGMAWREALLCPHVSLQHRHVLGPPCWLAAPSPFSQLLWRSARQPLSCQEHCHTEP